METGIDRPSPRTAHLSGARRSIERVGQVALGSGYATRCGFRPRSRTTPGPARRGSPGQGHALANRLLGCEPAPHLLRLGRIGSRNAPSSISAGPSLLCRSGGRSVCASLLAVAGVPPAAIADTDQDARRPVSTWIAMAPGSQRTQQPQEGPSAVLASSATKYCKPIDIVSTIMPFASSGPE